MEPVKSMGRKPRHLLRLPCQVVRERDFRLIADRLENLSVSGLSVSPAEPVLTGERLIVSFRLPRGGVWIDAEARVTRVIHGRRPGDTGRSLGLAFESLDEPSQQAIELELTKVPIAPPGRAIRDEHGQRIARVLAWFSTRIAPTWESLDCGFS
jgi:hypothetical protein